MGTGKSWTSLESFFAAKAFVQASEDPSKGAGKKRSVFETQVGKKYQQLCEDRDASSDKSIPMKERTGCAILQRYKLVKKESLAFEGLYLSAKALKPTGDPAEEDFMRFATAAYNKRASMSDFYAYAAPGFADPGPDFPFLKALLFLRRTNLWSSIMGVVAAARACPDPVIVADAPPPAADSVFEAGAAESHEASGGGAGAAVRKKRPAGAARIEARAVGGRQAKALEDGAAAIARMADAAMKRAKTAEGLVAIEERQYRLRLFSMDGTPADRRRVYLQHAQRAELDQIASEESAPPHQPSAAETEEEGPPSSSAFSRQDAEDLQEQ